MTTGAPVNNIIALIDKIIIVQAYEGLAHGARQAFIHGEAFPGPVAGTTQSLQLVNYCPSRSGLPFPHPGDKFFSSQIMPRCTFSGELLFHDILSRAAGTIHSPQPK